MLSTSKLSQVLVQFGAAKAPFGAREVKDGKAQMADGFGISDETYGRQSMIYVDCPDMATRRRLEAALEKAGAKPNREYHPGHPSVEVQVTYFKGFNYDE